jgi:hypothetical protein
MMTTDDTGGAPIPPYEGRKTQANDEQEAEKDGARTAGATAPVSDDDMKADDPADTERGAVASPSDEQAAEDTPDGESPDMTGPSHYPGTAKGEDQA